MKLQLICILVLCLLPSAPVANPETITFQQTGNASAAGQPGADLNRVERIIERLAGSAGGVVGVSAIHIESGRRVSFNGGSRFPMASVYKFPIALQLMMRVDKGEVRLSDSVTLTAKDYRRGYSALTDVANNRTMSITVERLLELMLGQSDNTASDALLKVAGGPSAVTEYLRALRIEGINVNRYEAELMANFNGVNQLPPPDQWTLDFFATRYAKLSESEREQGATAYANDPRDTSTPDAMADLLALLHRSEVKLTPASHERVVRIMTATQTGPARLKGMLPAGTVVAHKTGTMGGTTNDVGIITLPDNAGHVAIAVFVKTSRKEVPERERAIAEIARTIYDFFLLNPAR